MPLPAGTRPIRFAAGEKPPVYSVDEHERYYPELTERIRQTGKGDRIAVLAMGFEPSEPVTVPIVEAMAAAAGRGAEVYFGVDAYSFMLGQNQELGPLFWHKTVEGNIKQPFKDRLQVLKHLGSFATGHANIINQPGRRFSVPVAGRSHIKGAVVNDWWRVGGCNLDHADKFDVMAGSQDPKTADWLYGVFTSVIDKGNVQEALGHEDIVHAIDDTTDILVDVGVRGQSVILNAALEAIDQAEQWVMVSAPFLPSGRLGRHLARAHARGVETGIIYNNPRDLTITEGFWQSAALLIERLTTPRNARDSYRTPKRSLLHAKMLLTEKLGIIGSHNFIYTGVALGTAEISLRRRDGNLARQAARLMIDSLGIDWDRRLLQ